MDDVTGVTAAAGSRVTSPGCGVTAGVTGSAAQAAAVTGIASFPLLSGYGPEPAPSGHARAVDTGN